MRFIELFKASRLSRNPYFLFFPFLILYVLIALIFHNDANVGDEGRYLSFAHNLLEGYYSPPAPNIILTNGPGYPLMIMPFLGLKLPLICISLMNAILYYLSVVLLYKAVLNTVNKKMAVITGLFWACYFNAYESIPYILSELLTIFLVSLFLLMLVKLFKSERQSDERLFLWLSGLTFGYLVLTKFIFGYVLLIMLAGTGILLVFKRKSKAFRYGFFVMGIAFLINVPYLLYTYNLTGKLFYWGSAGGDSMYWMTTPYKFEYGNWYSFEEIEKDTSLMDGRLMIVGNPIKNNHSEAIQEISKYKGIERDDVLKRMAVENIKTYPGKFIQNCFSNLGRIFFNYPYSYTLQRPGTLLRLPMNGIILILMLYSLIPTIINWRRVQYHLKILLFIFIIYLGGSTVGTAETRMFSIIVPFLLYWIAIMISQTVSFRIKWSD